MQNKPSRQWTLLHAFMKQTESHTYINLFRQSEHSDHVVHKIHQLNHNSLKKNNYIEHFEALKKLGLRRARIGLFCHTNRDDSCSNCISCRVPVVCV